MRCCTTFCGDSCYLLDRCCWLLEGTVLNMRWRSRVESCRSECAFKFRCDLPMSPVILQLYFMFEHSCARCNNIARKNARMTVQYHEVQFSQHSYFVCCVQYTMYQCTCILGCIPPAFKDERYPLACCLCSMSCTTNSWRPSRSGLP